MPHHRLIRSVIKTGIRGAAMLSLAAGLFGCAQSMGQITANAGTSDYQARLAAYEAVHEPYVQAARAYWDAVSDKRRIRNAKRRANEQITLNDYVLEQPPVYNGPRRPIDPNAPPGPQPGERAPVPLVSDFIRNANEQFGFVPDQPRNEIEFKRAYARAASAAGLTRNQIVGVYAFETGGNGTYDTQAGVTPKRPTAISPALGYNQLLSTNSVAMVAEHGDQILAMLRAKERTLNGDARMRMTRKIGAVRRMIAFSHRVPQGWSNYDKLAKHTAGGIGIHAIVLDKDIGPVVQVQKLLNSVKFARMKHYDAPLSAPELELMNLTGDSTGLDMVMMPPDFRARVPTANFFQQVGYDRNPVAKRTAVVANLIADIDNKMAQGAQNQGAQELAAAF
ncbi:MAG: hypothetical protein GC182_23385 [Rhodopseudomonas sp.]|nr:hypothetical protein [Rhodopseudomonas sp.]